MPSPITVNGKPVYGLTAWLVAIGTIIFIGLVFFIIALVLLSPLLIPLLLGFLIGKAS